jgi:hypothetical protein
MIYTKKVIRSPATRSKAKRRTGWGVEEEPERVSVGV